MLALATASETKMEGTIYLLPEERMISSSRDRKIAIDAQRFSKLVNQKKSKKEVHFTVGRSPVWLSSTIIRCTVSIRPTQQI
jgi:hypothetical protein